MWMRADTFIQGQMFGMGTYAAALYVFTYFLKNISHVSTSVEVEVMRVASKTLVPAICPGEVLRHRFGLWAELSA